jgi:(1->4)-alpha-D-glucan 1-alpha-D-glucosylmutase
MKPPTATYRIQLQADFGFQQAADLLDYLHALGISHLYASPIFQARKGSTHGYDIEDPNQFNPELGGQSGVDALAQRLHNLEMGWIQDIVPNHMVYSGGNPLLADVLENGPRSAFYEFFDIQWDHPAPELRGAVSAPFLGEALEVLLDKGQIRLELTAGGLRVRYYDLYFPLALDAYPRVLCADRACTKESAALAAHEQELQRRVDRLVQSARIYDVQARRQALMDAKGELWTLYSNNRQVKAGLDERLQRINDQPFQTGLADLLEHQHFRLRHWTTAARQINYRRFFDINELITLRQDLPEVFDFTHHLIKQMVGKGVITGLRVDHVDGLGDPAGYLNRLRRRFGDLYIVAEKILGPEEDLADWPVQGTTGYEFAARMNALFCSSDFEDRLTGLYRQFTGARDDFAEISRQCKKKVLADQFSGDLHNLVLKWEAAMQVGSEPSPQRRKELEAALSEMLIALPVYRTYLACSEANENDQALLKQVLADAQAQRPDLSSVLGDIGSWLVSVRKSQATMTGKWITGTHRRSALGAFEQLAAPLTAKGIEDTALYRYNRLAALNEVGCNPDRFGASPQEFHAFAAQRQETWPHSLNVLSTHDTKRSADVRARMLVISELPEEWENHLKQWRECNAPHMGQTDGGPVPDPEMEYLLYQTVAATLPMDRAHLPDYRRRIIDYITKAAREAKQRTSWLAPAEGYEQALAAFVERILDPQAGTCSFVEMISPFAARIAHYGFFNAMAQNLIHLTAPGIPDIYQGTELFDDSLVDPDNRRPIDFQRRRLYLREIEKGYHSDAPALVRQLMDQRYDGRIKLYAIWVALQLRRRYAALFQQGRYVPLTVEGGKQHHAVAFARVADPYWVMAIVPRMPAGLVDYGKDPLGPSVWADTKVRLPSKAPVQWRNMMTREVVPAVEYVLLGQVFKHVPVALLIGEGRS